MSEVKQALLCTELEEVQVWTQPGQGRHIKEFQVKLC